MAPQPGQQPCGDHARAPVPSSHPVVTLCQAPCSGVCSHQPSLLAQGLPTGIAGISRFLLPAATDCCLAQRGGGGLGCHISVIVKDHISFSGGSPISLLMC